jgi:flagellar motor switch/type III secretory pathway protein FliN
MSACQPWLPDDAAAPPDATRALEALVEQWSGEWFVGESMRVDRSMASLSSARGAVWQGCDQGVWLGLPLAGCLKLGAMVLGVSPAGDRRNKEDVLLLEAIGRDCLDSLKLTLSQRLGLDGPLWQAVETKWDEAPAYGVEIASGAHKLALQLAFSRQGFARFVRAALPAPPAKPPLRAGSAAIAAVPVSVTASLGTCGLTVAELSGLECGDVLVLDAAIEAVMPLAVDHVRLAKGRCRVVERERGLALKIVEAPSR